MLWRHAQKSLRQAEQKALCIIDVFLKYFQKELLYMYKSSYLHLCR
jgi:hypothetical protein